MGKREVESLKRSKLNTHQEKIPILCVCAILCIVAPWLYTEHALFDSLALNSLFIKDSCLQIGALSIQLAWRRSSLWLWERQDYEMGGSGGESLWKLQPCRNQEEKKKAVVSFHANFFIKEDDEDICILIFLRRSSVCL